MAMKVDPFSRPSMFPDAAEWKAQLEAVKAARHAEELAQRQKEAEHEALVKSWQLEVQEMKVERTAALQKAAEVEEHARRQVQDYHWATAKQLQEMEERITQLQSLLGEERAAHAVELAHQADLVQQVRRECDMQIREAEHRHRAELAAEQERVREAHEMVELIQERANKDVTAARAREEARIAEIRAQAETRTRELEKKMREEASMRDHHLIERQRLMEEALYAHGQEKEMAIRGAQRHLAAMEQELQLSNDQREMLFAQKEERLKEVEETAKRNTDEMVKHHKELLDLERALHARTMERTMDRVVHHLKLTPEQQLLEDASPS